MFSEFFQANLMWFGALLALIVMLILDIKKNSLGGFKKVGALQLPLLQRDPTVLIDISAEKEFKTGHIADSINLPAASFSAENKLLPNAKDENVVVIDQTGLSAGPVAKKLRDAGFLNVFVLDGGLANWRKENFPLTSK